MKTIVCEKCGLVIAKINKGEVRMDVKVYCDKCIDKPKYDLPPGFDELFGGFKN